MQRLPHLEPTSSRAASNAAALSVDVPSTAERLAHRYGAAAGEPEEADRPSRAATADGVDTEDALIAALQGDREELLQRVSSMRLICLQRDQSAKVA